VPKVCERVRGEQGRTIIEVLTVVGILGVVTVMAAPLMANAIAFFRVSGDARSISNAIAVIKIRAASDYTQARLYVDVAGKTHHLEIWNKTTNAWTREGGDTALNNSVTFGYAGITNAPPNTQGTIDQAPACKVGSAAGAGTGDAIGNTACVVFNSRGVPVDSLGAPTSLDAVYVTDGSAVYGITVAPTGMVRSWRAKPVATTTWSQQ
jgi:Tfp pilus assembly protein FimT